MDNLSLAVLSSLDFLVIALCFSADSNRDILPIQYGYEYGLIWSRSFGRHIYFFVVNCSLFATKSSGIVEEEPRAVFLHLFRGVVFLWLGQNVKGEASDGDLAGGHWFKLLCTVDLDC